jgi:hypothetical protein
MLEWFLTVGVHAERWLLTVAVRPIAQLQQQLPNQARLSLAPLAFFALGQLELLGERYVYRLLRRCRLIR